MASTTESAKSEVKKEVKIVTNEVKKEIKTEEQNGQQNGDTEAVMTVKLPTKKSAAKTETKVEITKTTLPDGSVEEVKKTITKTTIDGKTEIKTKTETTIIPKDDEEEEEEEVEEEETDEGIVTEVDEQKAEEISVATEVKASEGLKQIRENGQDNIVKTEERSETTTTSTKKVVVVQDDKQEEDEEEEIEEEIEEAEPVTIVLKKQSESAPLEDEVEEEEVKVDKAEVEQIEQVNEAKAKSKEEKVVIKEVVKNDEEEEVVEEEEEYEEAEEKEIEVQVQKEPELVKAEPNEDDESEYTDEEIAPEKEEISEKPVEETKASVEETKTPAKETKPPAEELAEKPVTPVEIEIPIQKETDEKQEVILEKQNEVKQEVTEEIKTENIETPETKELLREPSVPLEKVEDVEIKPIGAGNFITKTRTETTEIITGAGEKPAGLLTEYNRTENIVTVNRTTKTLDYENSSPQTIPTLTYFTPHIEKFPPSPQPINRPHQPVYPSEPTSERRHSLLLERLSVERQIPTNEIYQNTQQYSQSIEQQNQWSQEPRVEILNIENVKPSSINKEQWYQQTDKVYNNVAPAAPPVAPSWTQPKPQQQAYQPPPQPAYQPQPTYEAQHQPKPVYQPPQAQPVYQSQPQYQPQSQYQSATPQPQPQYQTSYTENLQQNISSQQNTYSTQQNYCTYTPKPTSWDTPRIIEPNQYSSDSYQNTQQRSTSYVPPPWEQDSTYVVDNSQNYFQPQTTYNQDVKQDWKPTPPKATKTKTTAYIPPKPNQSFVKHVTIAEPPKQAGRKTYYSEYERRYISVPESTYIPGETKPQPQLSQPQPDPSPAYYYDNNEPAETVEHQWRKELREFTEKAQTQQPESVKPPWETTIESKTQSQYTKTQETYTATPTWSQTLRPQSWRERSFESEFVSQEWPKTSTLGRGRPLSTSYGRESSVPDRTRGVSVDRYNPNNYQAPVPEPHPPVQTFTHNPPAPHATGYHNPNVPAYHAARASAEPREQPVYQQPRPRVESRASPFQSRSFKYLQWITGTDD